MADDSSNGFLWFLAGLGIGAAVGVLYAPKPGRETREDILRAAEDGRELVRDRARQYRNQAGEWVDRGKDVVSQQKEQFRSAFEAGRQAYREATTEPETTTPKL
jgi:gas vesicle protein